MIKELWRELGRTARVGLVAGAACVVTVTALAGYWLLRSDYQVLFSDLTPQDAAAMSAELDRLKVPFTLGEGGAEGGTTILVDKKDVYRTRIKLMGKDIPLHGAVGFELFNSSDFGMTEFAQRINYQRALQGELTRTILALAEVHDVRVLLAMPEQGLFKEARHKATASITLTLKQGRGLVPAQVTGIQRLVAASVPGIAAQDVTVVDQTGIALSRPAGEGDAEASSGRLDLKRDTERYLTSKATDVLERTLGAGQALASVDVALDMDRVQKTIEDVVAAPTQAGRQPAGVLVKERETVREVGGPLKSQGSAEVGGALGGSSQHEAEYAVGRRVEQVMSQPGSIRRIQVVAVVKRVLDAARQEQIRQVVAASVGADFERGDTVVVQSIDALAAPASTPAAPGRESAPGSSEGDGAPAERAVVPGAHESALGLRTLAASAGLLLAVLVVLGLGWSSLRRSRDQAAGRAASRGLSESERQAALSQVKAWMRGTDAGRPTGEPS